MIALLHFFFFGGLNGCHELFDPLLEVSSYLAILGRIPRAKNITVGV